jgi:predicted ATPase/DNA-binding CsgD family transcriptional regulator
MTARDTSGRPTAVTVNRDSGSDGCGSQQHPLRADGTPSTVRSSTAELRSRSGRVATPKETHGRPDVLPSAVTSFVGRRNAAAEVKRALSWSRIVTLTGVAGVGKSRLAVHVADAVRRGFPDGVFFVELAAVTDEGLVANAIAATLDLRDQSEASPVEALVDDLRHEHVLLILDNCEHLAGACGDIVSALLSAAPDVRVLATSREPLNIAGETVWPVPPLSVPAIEPADRVPIPSGEYEALTLFEQRAAAVVPGFTLTDGNRKDATRLCARLDGLPLAIELAAVRLRALTLPQIVDRLESGFQLLTEGNRSALPRHRTLSAAISWSYDLCTEEEQELWARCAIFTGGFDLAAAEAVCSGNGIPRDEVLPGIVGLVDKSIIGLHVTAAGPRYRMLETIREFGRARLDAADSTNRLAARHRDYFAAMVKRIDTESRDGTQREWSRWLVADRPNLWAALDFCIRQPGESLVGLQMASDLWYSWVACGVVRDGRLWLERLLEAEDTAGAERTRALWVLGWILVAQGSNAAAARRLDDCLKLAESSGDTVAGSYAIQLLGVARMFANDLEGAVTFLDRALSLHRRDSMWTAQALVAFPQRALAAAMLGDLDGALKLATECRRTSEPGELWVSSWMEFALGLAWWLKDDAVRSVEHLTRSLTMKHDVNDQLGIPFCVELLAWVASARHDDERAAMLFGFADALWHRIGTPLFGSDNLLGWSAQRRQHTRDVFSAGRFAELSDRGRAWSMDQGIAETLGRRPAAAEGERPLADRTTGELTAREREVAVLVADGMSNRDVASRLVISPRTAEAHVEHILTKLGFSTRAQIASWVAAGRLADVKSH